MKSLALFDFDGTLTCRDSLPDFIRFAVGIRKMVIGAMHLAPILGAYAAKRIENGPAKEKVLGYFFSGWTIRHLKEVGAGYASSRIPEILRPRARERLEWHRNQGHVIAVVSASPDIWLQTWAESLGLQLICTSLEEENGRFSGRYKGINCNGIEKVRRIRERFDVDSFDTVYAYGDTSGDRPMLALADKPFYKPFRDQ
jgi:HAD superfamily hydrolase (TIGR01490 family)